MSSKVKSLLLATTLGITVFAVPAYAEGEQFVLIQHSPDSESWWNTVKNAATLAAEEVGVTVEFRNLPTGDLADMARIIEQTTAESPDGIIVTITDFDALSGPIQSAIDQGIPVVTINTGTAPRARSGKCAVTGWTA